MLVDSESVPKTRLYDTILSLNLAVKKKKKLEVYQNATSV